MTTSSLDKNFTLSKPFCSLASFPNFKDVQRSMQHVQFYLHMEKSLSFSKRITSLTCNLRIGICNFALDTICSTRDQ